jgi:PAS domain S-box-containing protein
MGDAEAAMLEALFTRSPVGLHLLDTELRIVRVNTGTAAMRGVRLEDLVGRRFTDVYNLVEPGKAEALVRGVLVSGIPVLEQVVRARPWAKPEQERYYAVSVFRLQDPRGAILGVAVAVVDVTGRERARARSGVLNAVRERVGRTLDVVVTCQELAETLVPGFADVAIVEVVDAVVRGDAPLPSPIPSGMPLLRAAFRSSGGDHQSLAQLVGEVRSLPTPTPYTQALADLHPRIVALRPDLPWLAADPGRAEEIRTSGAHTLLAVPLVLRGTVLGLVSLYRIQQADSYDEDDVEFSLQFADHAALCIDNARRYTWEHTVATTVQRHMLPRRPASHTALEIVSIPVAGGGGGWHDAIALSSARTAMVVGDVAGQGIQAPASMGQLRIVTRSLAAFDLGPDELLAHLNDTATLLSAERESLPLGDPRYREALAASCTVAVYDPLTRTCTAASAGHPAPVIAYPDGSTGILDIPVGPQLGDSDGAPFAAASFQIPDDGVLVFSNISTLTSPPTRGTSLVQRVLAHPDRPLQDLCDDILYMLPADIDVSGAVVLLARTRPFPVDRVAAWQLVDAPTAAATARNHVRRQLVAWHLGENIAFNTELIASELVTNALRYGSPPLELRLINDRVLTCEVRDTSPAGPHLVHARAVDEGGRGLFIIAQLAQAWGTRHMAEGKTVWAEQSIPSGST